MAEVALDQGRHNTITNGQKTVAVTNTAIALTTTSTGVHTVAVKALLGNGATVYVGGSGVTSATGLELAAGDGVTIAIGNLNLIYVNGASGDGVSYLAT